MQPDAGLHVDLAERVGENVVQLPGDAHPFGLHLALLALAAQTAILGSAVATAADALTDAEDDQDAERRPRDTAGGPRHTFERDSTADGRDPAEADRHPRPDAGSAHDRGHDREGQRNVGRAAVLVDEQVEGRGDGDDGDDRTREPAGSDQREWPEDRKPENDGSFARQVLAGSDRPHRERHLREE